MSRRVHLISIDPQNDFTATGQNPFGLSPGSLCVDGGQADMDRLATLIGDLTPKLDAIHVTLDQHHEIDIAHPHWFADENGEPAPVFAAISYDEGNDGFLGTSVDPATGQVVATVKLRTRLRSVHDHTRNYNKALGSGQRYPHLIWPVHCKIGEPGSNVYPSVAQALTDWTRKKVRTINWVAKGSNPFTEHFSAVQAEVPMPNDPSTQINTGFIGVLETADLILLTGEALSHCVANTGRDIVKNFSDPALTSKIVLISDTTSNVTGFEALGTQFIADMQALGMQVMTCSDVKSLIL